MAGSRTGMEMPGAMTVRLAAMRAAEDAAVSAYLRAAEARDRCERRAASELAKLDRRLLRTMEPLAPGRYADVRVAIAAGGGRAAARFSNLELHAVVTTRAKVARLEEQGNAVRAEVAVARAECDRAAAELHRLLPGLMPTT